jgi:hypothetical protein
MVARLTFAQRPRRHGGGQSVREPRLEHAIDLIPERSHQTS